MSVLTPNSDSITIEQSKVPLYNGTFVVTRRDAGSVDLSTGPKDPGTYSGGVSITDTFCPAQSAVESSFSIAFNSVTVPTARGYLYLHRNAFFTDSVNVSMDNNGMLSSSDSSSTQQVTAILTELAQTAGMISSAPFPTIAPYPGKRS